MQQAPTGGNGRDLRLGDSGFAVTELRGRLARLGFDLSPGEVFDAECDRALRAFQQHRGLHVDGVLDVETSRALEEARWRLGDRILTFSVRHPFVGDDVVELQQRLAGMGFDCGRADGIFGRATEVALRDFQRNVGLPVDGTCGPATFRALRQLVRTVVGGRSSELREYERLQHAGPTLAGKLVVIDPGHGGSDRGAVAFGLSEARLVDDIAGRIEGRLAAAGAQAFRTRGSDVSVESGADAGDSSSGGTSGSGGSAEPLADAERAAFANAADADLLLSLHIDGDRDPKCHGVATYYYGTVRNGVRSVIGARLAELMQDEIVERTDLLDCHSHPVTWELLRRTRMPAVRVDLGYLTNAGDAERLASAEFRDLLAEAIVVAVQRLYQPTSLPEATSSDPARLPVFT